MTSAAHGGYILESDAFDFLQAVEFESEQPLNAPPAVQDLYVSVGGSDINGDGSGLNPFGTIQFAMDQITDASAVKVYSINAGPGIFSDGIALKPWVGISGVQPAGRETAAVTVITGALSFDASWAAAVNVNGVAWLSFLSIQNINAMAFPAGTVSPTLNCLACVFTGAGNSLSVNGGATGASANLVLADTVSTVPVSVVDCGLLFLSSTIVILPVALGLSITVTQHVVPPGPAGPILLCDIMSGAVQCDAKVTATAPGATLVNIGAPILGNLTTVGGGVGLLACAEALRTTTLDPLSLVVYQTAAQGVGYDPAIVGDWNVVPKTVKQALDSVAGSKLTYTPAVAASWALPLPTTVKDALDRIAAHTGPIP